MNASHRTFRNGLRERYQDVEYQFDAALAEFAGTKADDDRLRAMQRLDNACRQLESYLATDDRPKWLGSTIRAIAEYTLNQNPVGAKTLVAALLSIRGQVKPILPEELGAGHIDFDAMYGRFRTDGNLSDLFGMLIEIARRIIESNAIDSMQALRALNELIDLLRANRGGSFAATKYTLFSVRFLWNFVLEFAKDVPVLRPGISAFEKTLEQSDKELERTQRILEGAVQTKLTGVVNPPVVLLGDAFHREVPSLPDHDTIDVEFTVEESSAG